MDTQHTEIEKKHQLEQHEVKQVLEFLKRYGALIGAGVVTAAITLLISRGIATHRNNTISEAEQMLISAQTPEQIEEVVNNYKSTPTASSALLSLAKIHYNNGNYTAARAQYERFIKEYKNDPALPLAKYGLAYCTEAQGSFDSAATQFETFLAENAGHYLSAPATLARARCLELAGKIDESRIVLENFLVENGESKWAGSAESQMQQLNKN